MSYPDHDIEATERTAAVLYEIARERSRQDAKWGPQNHPDGTNLDNAGWREHARELCQRAAAEGRVTWAHILQEEFVEALAEVDPARLRVELLQVAAVAVAWAEAIDRRVVDNCTHGADCPVHPDTNAPHNFDPASAR